MKIKFLPVAVLVAGLVCMGLISSAGAAEPAKEVSDVSADQPVAFLPEKAYEFEPVLEGTILTHAFVLVNKGTAPLELQKVQTTCGCTTVSPSTYPLQILPGKQETITVKVNTRGYGGRRFEKHIRVMTNDPQHRVQALTFSGPVERFATISPQVVRLVGEVDKDLKQTVEIIPDEKYPFKITSVKADQGKRIRFELAAQSEPGQGYVLTVEDRTHEKGRYRDMIRLTTDNERCPTLLIKVYGNRFEQRKAKAKK